MTDIASSHTSDNREAKKHLASILIGFVGAMAVLSALYSGRKTDFSDASALGAETTSVFASVDGHPIHCSTGADLADCIAGVETRKFGNAVVWLGNSQVHAVNQLQKGEQNAPPRLFEKLKARGTDLLTFSQPNANLQEHYLIFEAIRKRVPMRTLVLPLVFDDMREDGIRDDLFVLIRDPAVKQQLSTTTIGRKVIEAFDRAEAKNKAAGAVAEKTPQETTEEFLENTLSKNIPLWAARPDMRGDIFIGLYKLRNTAFGITPTTKRKIIRGRYIDNLRALEDTLSTASSAGISVLTYIAPVGRDKGDLPYDAREYQTFKDDAKALVTRYGAKLVDLENLVPESAWGKKDSTSLGGGAELDFMHFTAAGHVTLADELDRLLAQMNQEGRDRQ